MTRERRHAPGELGIPPGGFGVAVVVRFLLELASLAALAWWGVRTGSDDLMRAILAVGAPLVFAVVWGLVAAPKARNGLSMRARWAIGGAMMLLAAGALAMVGPVEVAIVLAVLVVVDTLTLLALDTGWQG
ncbi:MAG: YrdB family protein [Chloroflexi bacterium]|nr:YrdB family protein [Chloroflexota bacterium]